MPEWVKILIMIVLVLLSLGVMFAIGWLAFQIGKVFRDFRKLPALFIAALLLPSTGDAQGVKYRPRVLPVVLSAVSGASYGIHETVVHKPFRIPDGWNRQYWDASVSWTNKYKDNNPDAGSAFPGSTTVFVWTTDAKHLFGTVHRTTLFGAGVTITLGEKRPIWHYLLDGAISYAAFAASFHAVYSTDILFKTNP